MFRLARVAAVLVVLAAAGRMSGLVESITFYFPSRETFVTPLGVEDVWFTTPDGVRLHGWFMPATNAGKGKRRATVLHCHGNAGNIESHVEFSRFLVDAGVHVFLFDYRGYGRSDPARRLSRERLVTDALAAWDAMAARADVDAERSGVYGVSLGGAIAAAVAAERPGVRAVGLVSAFASFPSVAADHVPLLGPVLIPRGRATAESVRALGTRPLLIVHGGADDIVRPHHAERIAAAARAAGVSVERVDVPDAGHNDIAEHAAMRDATAGFFRRVLVEAGPGDLGNAKKEDRRETPAAP